MKRILILLAATGLALTGKAQSYQEQLQAFRQKYKNDFLTDAHSPLKAADTGFLRFYAADSSYRVMANVHLTRDARPFDMATHSGVNKKYKEYATLQFTLKGLPLTLHVYQGLALLKDPKLQDYLFIPFTDETNSVEAFGGGRYIDLRMGDIKDGTLALDFNKCYNPYCAYAGGYSCPIPPKENSLPVAIPVGEKNFGKAVKE